MFAILFLILTHSALANTLLIDCDDFKLPSSTCSKLQSIMSSTPHIQGLTHRVDELPEQIVTTHFLKKGQNVLELGSNTGRNTLTIASILAGESILYSSESSLQDRNKTKENLEINRLSHNNYHIIPAISKQPLEQKGWETRPKTRFGWLKGWKPAETVELPKTKFDVIIADCEGCLLKMTEEYPQLLENASTIILENDWRQYDDDNTMHQRFAEHQFQTVYTHHGPEAIIYSTRKPRGHAKAMPEAQFQHFYEVLVKKPPQA
jgi:hypothetical protein